MTTKHTLMTLLLAGGLLASGATMAGKQKPFSKKGYWVAETSENEPLKMVVRYYSWQHQLVHTEIINGCKLKFNNKQLLALKEKTDIAVAAAASSHRLPGTH